jgi:predicted N-acetyltransferase YhbS
MYEIRQEQEREFRETENVIREAFWNVYKPGCDEHYLAHVMRKSPNFVKELDLVAAEDGKVAGNVMVMLSNVEGDDGESRKVLTLGPIAVLPELQGRGIGSALVSEVKRLSRKIGYNAIVLCGNPDYYSRFGFEPAERYGIRNSEDMYADALMVCGLCGGELEKLAGVYHEDPVYMVDSVDVAEFDRNFPPRTPLSGTTSQKAFQELASRCRPAR